MQCPYLSLAFYPPQFNNKMVKLSLEQAMKAQRGSTGIALLFP
jgi:hypothetical protein